MKVLFYRVNNAKRKGFKINVERMLFFAFIFVFFIMLAAQTALMNPSIRTFLAVDNKFEGMPLGAEEYLYNEGEIGLKLTSSESDEGLKVLVNGEEAAVFTQEHLSLIVKDGDVIEIDGSGTQAGAEVEIVSGSDNISPNCVNKKVKVQSNIKELAKIQIE